MLETTEPDGFLPALAAILQDVSAYSKTLSQSFGSEPEAGSQADREMSLSAIAGDPSRPPADDVFKIYSMGAGICLPAATQHIEGLAQLYRDPMSMFSFQVVCRALVETTARAWWLLDPSVLLEVRLARLLTDELASLEHIESHRVS